jgi:hypothetical protein
VSEYDGEFNDYIMDFTKFLGPVFDVIFEHVNNSRPTPVVKNPDALIEWSKRNNLVRSPLVGLSNSRSLKTACRLKEC